MDSSEKNDFYPLVVTLCIDVLDNNKEDFAHHLEHHLKSDNWTRHLNASTIYIKDSYFVEFPHDFELALSEFAQDMQDLFSVSTSQLIKYCSCEEPIQGIAHLGNLGHVTFNITFDATTEKFTVLCSKLSSYGTEDDIFAAFENS